MEAGLNSKKRIEAAMNRWWRHQWTGLSWYMMLSRSLSIVVVLRKRRWKRLRWKLKKMALMNMCLWSRPLQLKLKPFQAQLCWHRPPQASRVSLPIYWNSRARRLRWHRRCLHSQSYNLSFLKSLQHNRSRKRTIPLQNWHQKSSRQIFQRGQQTTITTRLRRVWKLRRALMTSKRPLLLRIWEKGRSLMIKVSHLRRRQRA